MDNSIKQAQCCPYNEPSLNPNTHNRLVAGSNPAEPSFDPAWR